MIKKTIKVQKNIKKEKVKKSKLASQEEKKILNKVKPKSKISLIKLKKTKEKKVEPAEKPKKTATEKMGQYFEAVGRRKTSIARVRLFTQGKKEVFVNDKLYQGYFPTLELQKIVVSALETMKVLDKFRVTCRVKGGGIHSQAEAIRHGIAQALIKFNPDFRKRLKKIGYLTRDSRIRERKKFGLKRARRAPQWQKR